MHAVLVPIKSFTKAKARLSLMLGPAARESLAKNMAASLISAQSPLIVFVCCEDASVASWAKNMGAQVLLGTHSGLNNAVEAAAVTLGSAGFSKVAIAHGDLPFGSSLQKLFDFEGVTIVPDRHHQGTNVMVLPTKVLAGDAHERFRFCYGPGSLAAHCASTIRCGQDLHIAYDFALSWDIDTEADISQCPPQLAKRLEALLEGPNSSEKTVVQEERRP